MPTPQRLPIVNGDDGQWGAILRQFLEKEHFNDDTDNSANGGHQKITIKAGTTSAGTAPIKFTSGSLLSSPEAGAMEFNSDKFYLTQTSSAVRKVIAMYDDSSGATGDVYYRNSSGYFTRLGIGSTNDVLTVSGGLPSWLPGGTGSGDVSSNTASSVDSEIALFSGTGGKTIKRATGSGIAKITSGVLSTASSGDGDSIVSDATDSTKGKVELATASETTTGTDTDRAVTPDGLAGSDYGKRIITILVSDPLGAAITTGDGKAGVRIPSALNGYNLVAVGMNVTTVSSSGIPTVQLRRSRRSSATARSVADMLSTKLTVDASEFESSDAATAAVIDTANDDVATGDVIFVDIDVAGTGTKGLIVEMQFQLP